MQLPSIPFAAIVAQASAGVAAVDLQGRFLLVNHAYCRLTGRTEAELLTLRMQDITHPDDLAANLQLFTACVAEGSEFTIEKRYIRGDGTAVWVENSVSLLRGEDGAPLSVLAVSHDITRRKAVERQLLSAEERYRLIGRATNDVLWDWDHGTNMVVWSESLRSVFGYEPSEANGLIEPAVAWWAGRIRPEERDAVVATFMTAAESADADVWAKEYRFLAADGGYRDVIDRGYIARDAAGRPTRMIGSMQDVTALRAERRILDTILQQLPVGVIVADASGRLVFGNSEVERIWRHPFIASGGVQEYGAWKGFHPDGRPMQPDEWPLARAVQNGAVISEQVMHFERGDGSGRGVLQVSASPIEDSAGRRTGAVAVFSDITDRERAYEVARAAQHEAEAASRMKDEFLAMLSHELRTPLNAILGWARMLAAGSLPPARTEHAVSVILRNARAQAQMVEDLLDVTAFMRGRIRLDRQPLDLAATVMAAVDSVRPAAADKGIALQTALQSAVIVDGDSARLQQVVWNLLSNAVKFTPDGGIVDVVLAPRGEQVALTVRDSGAGIDPAFLPHVFDRFRQGDATSTRTHGGLGLGLAIARFLVEAHGGSISASSAGVDRGAEFTVLLPVGPASELTGPTRGLAAAAGNQAADEIR